MDDVITLYSLNKDLDVIKDNLNLNKEKIKLETNKEAEYRNFTLKKSIAIITPGLNLILGSPFEASSKRVIYDE